MRSVGVCVRLTTKKRPTANVVVLEGSYAAPMVVETFELTSNEGPVPIQLADLHNSLRSHLAGLKPERVVIRRADHPFKPSNQEGPRLRLLAEGALVTAACAESDDVALENGKDLAARAGVKNKATLDADAASIASGHAKSACAAALAGLAP